MSKLVTIFGGSGFLGRYITQRMAQAGWRVRVAVRRPNEAMFVKPYGVVGQVVPVFCNIRDDNSVREVLHGADVAINCVGTFDAFGKNNFDAVQAEGAERIARISAEEGLQRMVQISAIGADAEADSTYARTKAAGEAGVLAHMPQAVILRPSVLFGHTDAFFNRFAGMTTYSPVLPVVGAETRFQPAYVDDVAEAAALGALGEAAPGIYELGGPDVDTFRELMQQMLGIIRRRRLILNLPFWMAGLMARVFALGERMSFGLLKGPISRDQVLQLQQDNVVSEGARGFADLGISPKSMEAILPDYLWRFRPSGQYAAIKDSARNLKR